MFKKLFSAEHYVKRLDHFLKDLIDSYSRAEIEKYIKSGFVSVNGIICKKKSNEIQSGDLVEITIPDEQSPINFKNISIPVLYEDKYILVIDKPPNISVHPGAGKREITVSDYFLTKFPELKDIGENGRPGIVHRLDKGTSGVLILAKTNSAFEKLQSQFKKREIKKEYYAIVHGKMRFRNGSVNVPLSRNPKDRRKFIPDISGEHEDSRDALTFYSLRYQLKSSALVVLEPHTGRTHQLRVHLKHIGNPIMGDPFYGKKDEFNRLALHAYSITFNHPIFHSNIVRSISPIPKVFSEYLSLNITNK